MKLFVDDIRIPSDVGLQNSEWTIVRTAEDAQLFLAAGIVNEISFDHDLGEGIMSGFDLAKWIVDQDMIVVASETSDSPTGRIFSSRHAKRQLVTEDWVFRVHSANPIGAANIVNLLQNYYKFKFNTEDAADV